MEHFLRVTEEWPYVYDADTRTTYHAAMSGYLFIGIVGTDCKCRSRYRGSFYGDIHLCACDNDRFYNIIDLPEIKCAWCQPSDTRLLHSCARCIENTKDLRENLGDYIELPEICQIIKLYL